MQNTIKIQKTLIIGVLLGIVGCQQDDLSTSVVEKEQNLKVLLNKERNALSFKNREVLQDYVKEDMVSKDEIFKFYEEGFVPNRIIGGLEEEELDKAVSIIGKENLLENLRQTKNNLSKNTSRIGNDINEEFEGEEDDLIRNENFASLLNAEKEIIVNDTIFKYTEKGVVFTHLKNVEKLKKLDIESLNNEGEGLKNYGDVNVYVPRKDVIDQYNLVSNNMLEEVQSDIIKNTDLKFNNANIPENIKYNECNPSRSFIDNIFGKEYSCEYKFTKKRKLRTIFAVEDYYLFFDVYAQAKFKHKTWFGWYSSKEASMVFLKVDKAKLKFKRRKINIDIGAKQKDLVKLYGDFLKFTDKLFHVTNEFDKNGKEIAYSLALDEVKYNNNEVIVPENIQLNNNSNFVNSSLFNENVNKVVVINVLGKDITITDDDIYRRIYGFLKSKYGPKIEEIAVVVKKDNINKYNEITSTLEYIDYGKDLVKVNNSAVARKKFKFPKEFKINEFHINFSGDGVNSNDNKFKIHVNFGWNAVKGWDVSVKSGALYKGNWGGSSFNVIKN
ncbi:hypothetical protein [Candidatus Ornithobacterium hominis]|uniref:hypothetical protein n=1 Tax=Candidatus Ornithobacterium hominis TaxID=2497989 RepID=UPI000E5A28DA|nr:hypothetical protein [Candidatus Ornithobacterium hominis]